VHNISYNSRDQASRHEALTFISTPPVGVNNRSMLAGSMPCVSLLIWIVSGVAVCSRRAAVLTVKKSSNLRMSVRNVVNVDQR